MKKHIAAKCITKRKRSRLLAALSSLYLTIAGITSAQGAGILTPEGSQFSPIKIVDHNVSVTINNGFSRTQVTQRFSNPNNQELEAEYSFPLPEQASLSEVTVLIGERQIEGEVVSKEDADRIYNEEKNKGNEAGLATKNGIQDFRFKVTPIRPQEEVTITFAYYQPLSIDTGIARYHYPLEEGGTDEVAKNFWTTNSTVEQTMSINLEVKSAWPIASVRSPGYTGTSSVNDLINGEYAARYEMQNASLDKDFVFYYRLEDNQPGRIEVIPYKKEGDKTGTFMMIVTPGLDLQPINRGADYVFVLDVSGSMGGKLHSLVDGVVQTLGVLKPHDRFKIVTFSNKATDFTKGWISVDSNTVKKWSKKVKKINSGGGTDLYKGIRKGLNDLDADRTTSMILVTDGVTNQGFVNPKDFYELLNKHDLRIFGFLLGNSSNWPLMRLICNTTGGFYEGVSNSDDILGKIMTAKSKIAHEALHGANLKISGGGVHNTTDGAYKKIYRGQQLIYFGRYDKPGEATITLKASLTGEDKVYSTQFNFPDVDERNPEIERLWALNQIEKIEDMTNRGDYDQKESKATIRDLGLTYQLVTDETSMIVLSDETFKEYNIERKNRTRTEREHKAQSIRKTEKPQQYRVDTKKPAFKHRAPSFGSGAVDRKSALAFLLAIVGLVVIRNVTKHKTSKRS